MNTEEMNTEMTRKLQEIPPLGFGLHSGVEEGACVMEAVAYIAGEPWTDRPACVCPVISALARPWNDALDAEDRDRLLRPLIPRLVGTRASAQIEELRSLMAADWLVRVHAPAWLRLAGLVDQAELLEGLPEITSGAQPSIDGAIAAVRSVCWDNARDVRNASDVAKDAAVRDATRDATRAALKILVALPRHPAAAWTATDMAIFQDRLEAIWTTTIKAISTRRGDCRPTQETLQASAFDLVHRMIAAVHRFHSNQLGD